MADITAGIAPRKDTYANWVALNPTLGKTDSGKNYSQMIFATGSPVGDILLWGMAQSFTTAFAAGQYTIQNKLNLDSVPHTPYDISTANTLITVPTITSYAQKYTYYWTGGDGSNTFKFVTGTTIGGIDSALWVGEGEGHITIESDGTDYQVREYDDSESGWNKLANGVLIQYGETDNTGWTNTGSNTEKKVITLPHAFINTNYYGGGGVYSAGDFSLRTWAGFSARTTTTVVLFQDDGASSPLGAIWNLTGRWRT